MSASTSLPGRAGAGGGAAASPHAGPGPVGSAAGLPLIMGVVNVTPDSFSDGGRWFSEAQAVARGVGLAADGAAILDIGGESTRPGAGRPDLEEELRRTIGVVRRLHADPGIDATLSIDTMRAAVAAAAIDAGARIVNDVSGGLADPDMARVVADAGVDYVAMHWRGHSIDMQSRAVYGDVVGEVIGELEARVDALCSAGIAPERIIIDPGLGFAKHGGHNWALLGHLDALVATGHRVLIGASRKAFLGQLEADAHGTPAPPDRREVATAGITLLCAQAGVWCVRVHDVLMSRSVLRVASAVRDHSMRDGGSTPVGRAPAGGAPALGAGVGSDA